MVAVITGLLTACNDDPDPFFKLETQYEVDGAPLVMDTILYQNNAGNPYSVNKLQYYIHRLTLFGVSGSPNKVYEDAFYIDIDKNRNVDLGIVPTGQYDSVAFVLGIAPDLNYSGSLPNNMDNQLMAWPDQMGGGYHFMKFEGHFRSDGGAGATYGFAYHLGFNGCQAYCKVNKPFHVGTNGGSLQLKFNLNKVMCCPNTIDMDVVNYSMGDSIVMARIARNIENAFDIQFVEQ